MVISSLFAVIITASAAELDHREKNIVGRVNDKISKGSNYPLSGLNPKEEITFRQLVKENKIHNNAETGQWEEGAAQPENIVQEKADTKEQEQEVKEKKKEAQKNKVPEVQKSGHTADEVKDAVTRANNGVAQESDQQIINEAQQRGQISVGEDGKYVQGTQAPITMWTLYSELFDYQDTDQKDDMIMGKGSVSVDIPYSVISVSGNALAKNNGEEGEKGNRAGTRLASTLATYSKYNYISTVSGDSIAATSGDFLGAIGRLLGGLIAYLSASVDLIFKSITKTVADFLITLNLYKIIWDTTSDLLIENPIGKIIQKFLADLGITGNTLRTFFSFTFIFITAAFAFRLMRNISQRGVNSRAVLEPSQKWFYRILPVFVILPLCSLATGYLIRDFLTTLDTVKYNGGVADEYLINDRYWVANSNLSPTGGGQGQSPYATSETDYVDSRYAPYTPLGKATIKNINRNGYAYAKLKNPSDNFTTINGDAVAFDQGVSLNLISDWMANANFNVNTYAGDIKVAGDEKASNPLGQSVAIMNAPEVKKVNKKNGKFEKSTEKANIRNLADYTWSVAQSPDDVQADSQNYDLGLEAGVGNGSSFSNQSVALLLQSSFDTSGAHFYAYNIAPTGVQGGMTNLSTVKTQWKEVSLVGAGPLGQFGSWMAMVGKYFAITWMNLAILVAASEIGIFTGVASFVKAIIETVKKGSVADSFATFAYWFAIVITGLLVASLGGILIGVVTNLVTAVLTPLLKALEGLQLDGFAGIAEGGFSLFIVWLLVKPRSREGGKVANAASKYTKGMIGSGSLIESILGFPLEQAKQAHARMLLMFPTDRTMAYAGVGRGYYSDDTGFLQNPNIKDEPTYPNGGPKGANPPNDDDDDDDNNPNQPSGGSLGAVETNQQGQLIDGGAGDGPPGTIQGLVGGTGGESAIDTMRRQKQLDTTERPALPNSPKNPEIGGSKPSEASDLDPHKGHVESKSERGEVNRSGKTLERPNVFEAAAPVQTTPQGNQSAREIMKPKPSEDSVPESDKAIEYVEPIGGNLSSPIIEESNTKSFEIFNELRKKKKDEENDIQK